MPRLFEKLSRLSRDLKKMTFHNRDFSEFYRDFAATFGLFKSRGTTIFDTF